MSSHDVLETEQAIMAVLERQRKDFLTLPQLVKAVGAPLRKRLGLGAGMRGSVALQRLAPYLGVGGPLRSYKKGVSNLVGKALDPREIVLRQIQERPKSSLKVLAQRVPVLKAEFVVLLNRLLEERAVVCSFDANYQPSLRAAGGVVTDDRAALEAAYEAQGRGARYVRIHRLRQHLGWPRERFDRVLAELRADYTIDLHGRDPSIMTEQEITDSYIDENNLLHLTLTWRR